MEESVSRATCLRIWTILASQRRLSADVGVPKRLGVSWLDSTCEGEEKGPTDRKCVCKCCVTRSRTYRRSLRP